MWLLNYFNFERNYDVFKSKSPCIMLNKNINFNKNKTESRMENPTHRVLERRTLCSYKNRRSKVKLWWVGARERKKRTFFVHLQVYLYISKNFISYTFLLVLKIVKNLQCILKNKIRQKPWKVPITEFAFIKSES